MRALAATPHPPAPRGPVPANDPCLPPGVVRPARRPDGWCAPGPPPAGASGDASLSPGPGEDLCHLLGDWRILQRIGGHRWSLDDLVTAWLAVRLTATRSPAHHLDLGTGIGSVLMMVAWHHPHAVALGVEAQAISVDLARRSLRYNGVAERARVHHGDLRAFDPGDARYDLITGTPPYFPPGTATPSPAAVQKDPCRLERRGGVADYAAAAARALARGGLFVCCHAAAQRPRMLAALAAAGFAPTHLCDVAGRVGKAPLVTVGAFRRRADPATPSAPAEEAFAVRGRDTQWTAEFRTLRRTMGMPDRPPSPRRPPAAPPRAGLALAPLSDRFSRP